LDKQTGFGLWEMGIERFRERATAGVKARRQ